MIKVLDQTDSHKWLGCMLCAFPGQDFDVEYYLQQAAAAFHKHHWMLQWTECSIKHRLRCFEAINVQFRKFIRRIVGPPPGTNWSAQWRDFLHKWNLRVDHWARASGIFSLVK